jgi:glycosyltransferase involved in cell wall biosynthesis
MQTGSENIPVTVLMTTLNSARFVKEAVQSILDQTFTEWKLLIIDGGSSDGTIEILRQFTDSRISIEERSGLRRSGQLNEAFAKINTPFVAILDSDDYALPRRLEEQLRYFELHPDTTLLGSWGHWMSEHGERGGLVKMPYDPNTIQMYLATPRLVRFNTAMFRSSLLQYPMNVALDRCEDVDWYFRISKIARFAVLPEPLMLIRQTPQSLSRRKNIENDLRFSTITESVCGQIRQEETNEERIAFSYLWQGVSHYYYGSKKKATHSLLLAWKHRIRNGVLIRYLLPVLLLPEPIFKYFRMNNSLKYILGVFRDFCDPRKKSFHAHF